MLRIVPALLLAACETSIYYPAPLEPPEGWEPVCAGVVVATVTVENDGEHAVEAHELLPDDCSPSFRGSVPPGESAALGDAIGRVWRIYDADDRDWLGTFELVDGENVLVVP
jgi:hypothetical protein